MYTFINGIFWSIIVVIVNQIVSDNREINLLSNTTWSDYGVTVAGWSNGTNGSSSVQLSQPRGITITDNDILYISDLNNNRIIIIDLKSSDSIVAIGATDPYDVSIIDKTLFILDWYPAKVKNMSLMGLNQSILTNNFNLYSPQYFFIDQNNSIYVSATGSNVVVLYQKNFTNYDVVAGDFAAGSGLGQLDRPHGIFVNPNGTIYVADRLNDRIVIWLIGMVTGEVIAGNGVLGNSLSTLDNPVQVIVDTNEYLYIAETAMNRVTRWSPYSVVGFCIAGCTGTQGSGINQLYNPYSFAFDKYGSLYVSDTYNHRIQKFQINKYQPPSYNQPMIPSCWTWNTDAITFADNTTIGTGPVNIFINNNDTIHAIAPSYSHILIWSQGVLSSNPIINTSSNNYGIFGSNTGDVFVDYGDISGTVKQWTSDGENSTVVMYIDNICFGMFIDIYNNLYCSISTSNRVLRRSLNDNRNTSVVIAGNGMNGSTSDMLNSPRGIFLTMNLDLYVADFGNNRIQLFHSGQLIAITIVPNMSLSPIILNGPSAVILDADENLFITDYYNHRIITSYGLTIECLFGCTNTQGSAANQLDHPCSLSFDSYGNIYVLDKENNRIQKFLLTTDSCNESSTSIDTSTISVSYITSTSTQISFQSDILQNTSTTLISYSTSISMLTYSLPNILHDICSTLKPCQNNATCINNNSTRNAYMCICLQGFNGTNCQYDRRPCQSQTCQNNGQCNQTSNTIFICQCIFGWQGIHCETKINYCTSVECFHNGVCQALFLNYSCLCLGDSYSGRHCEIKAEKIAVLQKFSRSFAYIVIIAMIMVALFVFTLDILKFVFGIDPTKLKVKKQQSKKKRHGIPIRYIYVNKPSINSTEKISTISENCVA